MARPGLVLDFGTDLKARTIEMIAIPFLLDDYAVHLRARPNMLTLRRSELLVDYFPGKFLWAPASGENLIYCCDDLNRVPNELKHAKTVLIDFQMSTQVNPAEFDVWFPLLMHPHTYLRSPETLVERSNVEATRPVRILFAGNYGDGYDQCEFLKDVGIPGRNEVVDAYIRQPGLNWVENAEAWERTVREGDATLAIFDRSFRVWQNRWVAALRNCDFFLCPPGLLYPPAHNAYEAMAAGCIPIICYPDWFVPALEDGVNCLAFRTPTELQRCIDRAVTISDEAILRMRRAVVAYHENYLTPSTVLHRLLSSDRKVVRARVFDERVLTAERSPSG